MDIYRKQFGLLRGVMNAMAIEGLALAVVCLLWHAIAGGAF